MNKSLDAIASSHHERPHVVREPHRMPGSASGARLSLPPGLQGGDILGIEVAVDAFGVGDALAVLHLHRTLGGRTRLVHMGGAHAEAQVDEPASLRADKARRIIHARHVTKDERRHHGDGIGIAARDRHVVVGTNVGHPANTLSGIDRCLPAELPPGPEGRRRQVSRSGYATAEEAVAARDDLLRAHRLGTLPSDDSRRRETTAVFLAQWLSAKESSRSLRPSTVVAYRRHLDRYLVPYLGGIRVRDLRRDHIERMFFEIRKSTHLSPSTERRILATLRSAVRDAVRAGELQHDHTAYAPACRRPIGRGGSGGAPTSSGVRPAARPTRRLRLLRIACPQWSSLWREPVSGWARCAPFDGARSTSTTVCLSSASRRSRSVGSSPTVDRRHGPVKTGWCRWPAGSPRCWRTSGSARSRSDSPSAPTISIPRSCSPSPTGPPMRPGSVSRAFTRLVQASGMPSCRFHDLRHVAATTLLQAGVPMPVVSRILGHSSIQITVDTYGHVTLDPALHDQVHRALSAFAR